MQPAMMVEDHPVHHRLTGLHAGGGYRLPGLAEEGATPEQMLAALGEYVAWLGTLDLGIKVNHPLQSIELLPADTTGHGVECIDLHDALRLRFQLTHEEAELACVLLKDPTPPLQPASSACIAATFFGIELVQTMWEVLSRLAQIGSFHAGRPGKSPSIHTVAPTGSSEPDNAENCDRQSALLDPKAFFQCSSSPGS